VACAVYATKHRLPPGVWRHFALDNSTVVSTVASSPGLQQCIPTTFTFHQPDSLLVQPRMAAHLEGYVVDGQQRARPAEPTRTVLMLQQRRLQDTPHKQPSAP
jgi:hypothetical protein